MGKKAPRPYISFAEVKEKCPIPEVLEKLGLLEKLTRKGDKLSGVCVLPSHVHGPSPNPEQFKIDRRKGEWLWHCFGCDHGGDVIELVMSDAALRAAMLSYSVNLFWLAAVISVITAGLLLFAINRLFVLPHWLFRKL